MINEPYASVCVGVYWCARRQSPAYVCTAVNVAREILELATHAAMVRGWQSTTNIVCDTDGNTPN